LERRACRPMMARPLFEKAMTELDSPVGVRLTGPIIEAPERALFIAHRSGFTPDRRPMSGGPFARLRMRTDTGEVLDRAVVRDGDAMKQLFPSGLTPLEQHVVPAPSSDELRHAYRLREQLQERVVALYGEQRVLHERERADVSAFGEAFWRVLWMYELPAYEALGGDFLAWLESNGGGRRNAP